ncbi:hypothetical protein [Microcystis sp.]|uniref:hypothetical protein n=1 Tax=Microcystis sp. TaxID=1127 RepID=UPI003AF5CB3F
MQIEIQGADAIKVAQDILEMEGVQGSYEVISEVEREGTLATIATIIGIISGTIAIAEKFYQLKQKIDSPETPKIERVLIVSKNGDRLLLKDATLEQRSVLSVWSIFQPVFEHIEGSFVIYSCRWLINN